MFRKLGLMLVPLALLSSGAFAAGNPVIAYYCASRYIFYATPENPACLDDATLGSSEVASVGTPLLAQQMEFGFRSTVGATGPQMQVYFYAISPDPDPGSLPGDFPLDTFLVAGGNGGVFPDTGAVGNPKLIGGLAFNYGAIPAGNYRTTVTLTGLAGGGFKVTSPDYAVEVVFTDPTSPSAIRTDMSRIFSYGSPPARGVNKDAYAEDDDFNGEYQSASEFFYFGGFPFLAQLRHGVFKSVTQQVAGLTTVESLYTAIVSTPGFQLLNRPVHISADASDEMDNGQLGEDNAGGAGDTVQSCTWRWRLAKGSAHSLAVRICGFLRQKLAIPSVTADISATFDRGGAGVQTGDGDESNDVSDGDIINHILDFGSDPGSTSGYPCDDADGDETISDGDIIVDILNFGQVGDPM